MKILIIEDDVSLANVLTRRLIKYGYQCEHLDNASAAVEYCRQYQPNVILLDMNLHDESSLKYITALKSTMPDGRIILMTGYASIATAVDAIKLGADEYLAKPVDSQTLLAAIQGTASAPAPDAEANTQTLSSKQFEWEHINQALKFNQGNISATARQLSMHRRTLQRKLQKKPSFN